MMRRVVVTGMGIWSCIGQDLRTVADNLKSGYSGIVFDKDMIAYGLQSGLIGDIPQPPIKSLLPRRQRVLMSKEAEYAYMATSQALCHSQLDEEYLQQNEVGFVWGGDGNMEVINPIRDFEENQGENIDMYAWIRSETSNVRIALTNLFHLTGISFCTGAACASGSHAIGIAMTYIRAGMQDVIIAGGACEVSKDGSASTDVLGALSLRNNDPSRASRPFDEDRDGMIPSGGAAALVLEEYEHAQARGAMILAEVCGYGFSCNGLEEISSPSAEAEYIAMKRALDDADLQPCDIDYVNAHATSTIAGDVEEAKALTRLFVEEDSISNIQCPVSNRKPFISSTKSMTGHENWMAGASEAVYSILMMQNNFVAPNINLEHKIDEAKDLNIVTEAILTPICTVLSNSSGMGGTNSALEFRKI